MLGSDGCRFWGSSYTGQNPWPKCVLPTIPGESWTALVAVAVLGIPSDENVSSDEPPSSCVQKGGGCQGLEPHVVGTNQSCRSRRDSPMNRARQNHGSCQHPSSPELFTELQSNGPMEKWSKRCVGVTNSFWAWFGRCSDSLQHAHTEASHKHWGSMEGAWGY